MTTVVVGNDCIDAWKKSVDTLLESGELYNLVIEISQITSLSVIEYQKYNPLLKGGENISNVINTIFPERLWLDSNEKRDEFYKTFLSRHNRSMRIKRKKPWGSYFQRLIAHSENGRDVNQLERAITCLNTWKTNTKAAHVFHTATPFDSPRPRGGQCLQYIELLYENGSLNMLTVYRKQDFFNKGLGNYVGLAKLLSFICSQTGLQTGNLVSHVGHAYYDGTKTRMRSLLDQHDTNKSR
jgi:thymidylate synthase